MKTIKSLLLILFISNCACGLLNASEPLSSQAAQAYDMADDSGSNPASGSQRAVSEAFKRIVNTSPEKAANTAGIVLVAALILGICLYAYTSFCTYVIANKMGADYAWLAWVPIANLFLLVRMADLSLLWLLILFAPLIPFIGQIAVVVFFGFVWYRIATFMDKPGWLGILCIIPLVNLIIIGYLAFSR